MATLAVQQIAVTGTAPTYAAATAGGDAANPQDRTCLHVKNGSAGSINVTLAVPGSTYGQPNPDPVIAVPAGGDRFIYLPPAVADPSTGLVSWTYSAVTSVTVALLGV
jgi:hypothetical protein